MGKRVVVIDDDPFIRSLVKDLLIAFGHAVEAFEKPAEGVAYVQLHFPELVVVDFMMPAMTGYQAIEEIRKGCGERSPKFILLTATLPSEHAEVSAEARPDFFVEKPFDPQTFLQILAQS